MKSSIKWIYFLLLILISIVFITSCDQEIENSQPNKDVEIGPAGGYIFYENDNYLIDGWRYLEAAPMGWYKNINDEWETNDDPGIPFGFYWSSSSESFEEVGTTDTIGSGRGNTEALVTAMGDEAYTRESSSAEKSLYAAKVAYDYNGGGYSDWFLPSKSELDLMYQNLHKNELGGFLEGYYAYWSSSEYNQRLACYQSFSSGDQSNNNRECKYRVRPIRAF